MYGQKTVDTWTSYLCAFWTSPCITPTLSALFWIVTMGICSFKHKSISGSCTDVGQDGLAPSDVNILCTCLHMQLASVMKREHHILGELYSVPSPIFPLVYLPITSTKLGQESQCGNWDERLSGDWSCICVWFNLESLIYRVQQHN